MSGEDAFAMCFPLLSCMQVPFVILYFNIYIPLSYCDFLFYLKLLLIIIEQNFEGVWC